MSPSFRLFMLGNFRLESANQAIPFARRKAAGLLAYLALNPQEHAREKLAAIFWGDSTDADARRALRVTLTDLRRALGEEAFLGGRDSLQLNPAFPMWVDANEFLNLGDWKLERGLPELQTFLTLYQGDLLSDFYDAWITPHREELRALYVSGLLLGTAACRSHSNYAQALEFARKILVVEPGHEQAYQHLMFCHAMLGDRSALQQDYADCQQALREELGVEPSKETHALYERLLLQTQTSSPAARLTNLPRPLTSFVGRVQEIQALGRLLDPNPDGLRFVTLTGAGGSGKTRLAIQVGHDLLPRFAQGVWWVDLSTLGQASLVPHQVLKALGVPETPSQESDLQTLQNHLQSRQLLLILDNCEHLLAACAALTESLLAHAPALQVLATSREPLGVGGEYVFQTPTLSLPTSAQLAATPGSLMAYEAVKLFVDRASLRMPAFHLTEQNAALVAQICLRLDGIPLALELAAVEVSAFTLGEIAARLTERLDLAHPSTERPTRSQTLRATVAWSYDLLNEAEQTLFRRLAVFAGGWALDQAVVVAGGYPQESASQATDSLQLPVTGQMIVESLLSRLVEKSLVQLRQLDSGRRYAMLETIRDYATERLAVANETEAMQKRHYAFFTQFAEAAHFGVQGSDSESWLSRVETDHDNLRFALQWAISKDELAGATSGLSLQLAGAMWPFWYSQGHISEGEHWLNRALDIFDHPPPSVSPEISKSWDTYQARALTGLGTMAWIKGEHAQAERLHRQALALYKAAGDLRAVAMTLNNTATSCIDAGRYSEATILLEEGLELARNLTDAHPRVFLLVSLGGLEQHLGDFALAGQHYTEALQVSRAHGLKVEACMAQNNLGDVALWQGDPDAALQHYSESLAVARELGVKLLISGNLIFSALALYLADRLKEAQTNCRQALEVSVKLGYTAQIVECLVILGFLAEKQGQWEAAVRLLAVATAHRDQLHYTFFPIMQAPYAASLTRLRSELAPAQFESVWSASQNLTLQAAVESVALL